MVFWPDGLNTLLKSHRTVNSTTSDGFCKASNQAQKFKNPGRANVRDLTLSYFMTVFQLRNSILLSLNDLTDHKKPLKSNLTSSICRVSDAVRAANPDPV